MWKTPSNQPVGTLDWSDDHGNLSVRALGGEQGIAIGLLDQSPVSLSPVGEMGLPVAGEVFCGDTRANVNFPQSDTLFAMRLAVEVIDSTADRLVVECCVSVQTDLLDSYPKVDLDIACQNIDSIVPTDLFGKGDLIGSGTAQISTATMTKGTTSVILGPHDQPFTTNLSTDTLLRLRLFGDFLEKGVIRRARPWLVFDRKGRSTDEQLASLWKQISESPVPLS